MRPEAGEGIWDQRLGYPLAGFGTGLWTGPVTELGGTPPPGKRHGTRGSEETWDQRLGYPHPGGEQTENITFPRTSYARGNNVKSTLD